MSVIDHELAEGFTRGHRARAGAYENHADGPVEPLQVWVLSRQFDSQKHAQHVREESGEPRHAHLPLVRVHGLLHPVGNGGLEEGQRDVADDKCTGHHGDIRVNHQFVNGGAHGHVLTLSVGEGLKHQEAHHAVRQTHARQDRSKFRTRCDRSGSFWSLCV